MDRWGQPLQIIEPLGRTTTITRSGILAVKITHPGGGVDTTAYNASGQVTYQQTAGQLYGTSITYNSRNLPTLVKPAHGPGVAYTYTTHGADSTVVIGSAWNTFLFLVDSHGRDTLQFDPAMHQTYLGYDAASGNRDTTFFRPTSDDVWLVEQIKSIDMHGRDSVVVNYAMDGAPTDSTTYDVMNRPTRVAINGWHKTMVYDPLYRTQVKDNVGHTYKDTTNALGWVIQHTDPAGTSASYRYNLDGLLTSITNRRGQVITQQYDSLNRLVSKTGTAVVADSFAYDVNGFKSVGWNAIARDSIFTAPSGWTDSVVTHLIATGQRIRRYYRPTAFLQLDSMNVLGPSSIAFVARKFYWDSTTGKVDSIRLNGKRIKINYDSALAIDSVTYPTSPSKVLTYTYTAQMKPLSYGFGPSSILRAYGYDIQGRFSEEDESGGAHAVVRALSYDSASEITKFNYDTIFSGSCTTTDSIRGRECSTYAPPAALARFTYDSAGNLVTEVDSSASGKTTSSGSYTDDRLTGFGSPTYTYDNDGNRTRRIVGTDTTYYKWTADGALDTVVAGSVKLLYDYGPFGELVRRSRNGAAVRYFVWDGSQLLAELDSSATHRIGEYVYGGNSGGPLAMIVGTDTANIRYFAVSPIGNVLGTFWSGTSNLTYDYDPWGAQQPAASVADTNRVRWKSLLWEGDSTQLYYAGARWYDPATRRFLSEDPAGVNGGLNPYLYAGNSPVMGTDVAGLMTLIGCQIGWFACASGPDEADTVSDGPLDGWTCDVAIEGGEACLVQAVDFLWLHFPLEGDWNDIAIPVGMNGSSLAAWLSGLSGAVASGNLISASGALLPGEPSIFTEEAEPYLMNCPDHPQYQKWGTYGVGWRQIGQYNVNLYASGAIARVSTMPNFRNYFGTMTFDAWFAATPLDWSVIGTAYCTSGNGVFTSVP